MKDNIIISRKRGGNISISTTESNLNRLKNTSLKYCPFSGYKAIDLLRDLLVMYAWKIEYNKPYSIKDFLTITNDAHAKAYFDIFV